MSYQANLAPTVAYSAAFASALDATQVAPSSPSSARPFEAPVSAARTTVLPHVDGDGTVVQLSLESRSRYQPTRLLGAGGMGEVVLVDDHDIQRKVALKRLLPQATDPALLARFVDEIRCVGRLEHPNIVPIHDVGVDELGRYFFVMKYVEGETLERIIERLAEGDPAYVARYSIEVRVQIFLGLLHALAYAHERGIVHRDVKPANVMVGRFGEVVLMDWGVAKPLAASRDAARGADASLVAGGAGEEERARMYATRVGALVGTPAYMAPEQARGDIAAVDARSDIYSAIVLFHELLGLRHYLADRETLEALLAGIISEEFGVLKLIGLRYPGGAPPTEYLHACAKGLSKDPAERFQSAGELIARLHAILEGRVPVQCPITATKRSYRELGRVVDRRPFVGFAMLLGILAAVAFSVVQLARMALA
jgi:serine/threonine-protein kinase